MTYHRTIRLADTDAAGVVYFAKLLSICHEAYEDVLEKAGIGLRSFLEDSALAIPIVHGEIDFFGPLFCGDQLAIELIPQQIDENSFEVAYQVLSYPFSENCLARALTRHISINPVNRRRLPLPQSIRQWLQSGD